MTTDVLKDGPRAKRFIDEADQFVEPAIDITIERHSARVSEPALDRRSGRSSCGQGVIHQLMRETLEREIPVAFECEIGPTENGVHRDECPARLWIGRSKRNQLGKCRPKLHRYILADAVGPAKLA
jgi:hypothetical protein